ncbi:MAG: TIGR00725 family protein [Chloroflexi bacterium]|nr:TIGR00725 family protein [Chloroflexota bacterium]
MTIIGVIGAGACASATAETAEAVGREIARRKAILVCGGLGGVMEAACRGAKSAGGTTVGILPGTSHGDANRYVDIPIVTGLDQARNVLVVRTAHAVIAVGGAYGTLSEIGFALKLGRPVIGLGTWSLFRQGTEDTGIIHASTPGEAVALAFRAAERIAGR